MPEPSDSPIIHYLKTIVSWTTAVDSLAHKPPTLPIRAHTVSVPHFEIPDVEQHIDEFKATLLEHSHFEGEQKDTARDLLNAPLPGVRPIFNLAKRAVVNAPLHAEALLMALSRSFCSPEAANIARNVLRISEENRKVLLEIFQVRHSYI